MKLLQVSVLHFISCISDFFKAGVKITKCLQTDGLNLIRLNINMEINSRSENSKNALKNL